MTELAQQRCVPCEGGALPLTREEAEKLAEEVPSWKLAEDAKHIEKTCTFKNWKEAIAFTNKISDIAEAEGHHPDLVLSWGRVEIELSTHAIKGLSVNDFILAAKIDKID